MNYNQLSAAVEQASKRYPGYAVGIVVQVHDRLLCLVDISSVMTLENPKLIGLMGIKKHEDGVNFRCFQLAPDEANLQLIKEFILGEVEQPVSN
jgi:hypothetical protein